MLLGSTHPLDCRCFRPKLTKKGYWTNPPIDELLLKSQQELERISNFSIRNSVGSIEFLEEVDLTFCDLDEIVSIKRNYVKKTIKKCFFFLKMIKKKYLITKK